MPYTDEEIAEIVRYGEDPANRRPVPPEEREQTARMADAIGDAYTDYDWRVVLNTLNPARAAYDILTRPTEDRQHLLGLIEPDHRTKVEQHLEQQLAATA